MYKSILVPLDGSKLSECSLQHAQEIARGCHVPSVTLLTVIQEHKPFIPEGGGQTQVEAFVKEAEQIQESEKANANKYLAEESGKFNQENIDVKFDIVQASDSKGVADAILEYAKNSNADLIIMSTHGRSGISRWAIGSIADKIVRSSVVPVLTIAPAGCRK
jgi:nucleotide-binding universal stress UspA family protein